MGRTDPLHSPTHSTLVVDEDFVDAVLQFLKSVEINDIFDISLVTICIYSVLLTIQKTRAVQIIQEQQ